MNQHIIYLLPIFFSLFGALLCILPFRYMDRTLSVIASVLTLSSAIYLLFQPSYINGYFYIDGLSKLLILTIAMVYISTVLYSLPYIKHLGNLLFQHRLYYFLLNVFVATMFFSVIMDNLGLIWVGIEATTVSSALLIATQNNQVTVESAWRYVIIVSTGLVISLIAITFIYGSAGTLSLHKLLLTHPDNRVFLIGILLGIVGFGTKAGIFPMHTWLPDVHGKAPAPVSAIFSGVLLPVALYAMARLIQIYPVGTVRLFTFILGTLTVITASLMMTVQTNYKRMFAYSSMENMGMILIGFSLGGYGLLGAVIIIVSHGLAKSGVFFLTGDVLSRYHTTEMRDVNSLMQRLPRAASSLFIGSMAVTGAPPFAIFVGELFIFSALIAQYGWLMALVIILFLAIAFIAVNFKTGKMIFSENEKIKREKPHLESWIAIVNLILSFLVILFIPYFELLLKNLL
ncbi:hydrogenase 4 subunit F [Candidatus Sulfidibacterium hydrothermale]|uniref:proton-conducting transporter transmembrane domain-containing protein n=1 Tax=Candidatus Sulfidibacterium hydrothermale TaxID=2875962 RepID=UPI001F0B0D52|nr:proton-conducting transporter membrane subunit [Candidatus Sulfidibacterium hydrothermale]UBM63131.1 hydrogenase 4 subunit F [Candidatus Sulfidibacterium hydrothermale]